MKRIISTFMAFVLLVVSASPGRLAIAAGETLTKGDIPADTWPTFTAYTNSDGKAIYDPASEPGVSPIESDITSGVDRGVGKLPSVYVASDGTNFFVRLRLKGDPRSSKGGFLSAVWEVQLASGDKQVATIGLNGKPTFQDYIYVANADGTNVQPVYATPASGGSMVPGTNVTPAENGQYFLDFQVPIARVSEIAPDITATTPVKLFYGTSMAANLSVINKEYMQTASGDGDSTNYAGLAEVTMKDPGAALTPKTPSPVPMVTIDTLTCGQATAQPFPNNGIVAAGKATSTGGNVAFQLNGNDLSATAVISNGSWSLNLSSILPSSTGIYLLTAKVTNTDGSSAKASKSIEIDTGADSSLTIDGGGLAYTSNSLYKFTGSVKAAQSGFGNNKVVLYVDGQIVSGTGIKPVSYTDPSWTYTLTSAQQLALRNGETQRTYSIEAHWTDNSGKNDFAVAKQTLVFIPVTNVSVQPVTISIDTVLGDAKPTISGSSSAAETVEVQIDGVTKEIAVPASNGAWSIAALEKPLSKGTHTITAIAKKGNEYAVATKSHNVTSAAVAIDNGATVTLSDNTPTIRGNTNVPDSSSITVTIKRGDGSTAYTTAVNPVGGRWTMSIPEDKKLSPDGNYAVTAAVDGATDTQTLIIDTGTSVDIVSPKGIISGVNTVFNGNTEQGATVNLTVKKDNSYVLVKSITADGTGKWQFACSDVLSPGSYTITAVASDKFGNEALAEGAFSVPGEVETSHTLYFNAQGGTVSISNMTVINGSTYSTLPIPQREGYSFQGWYTASNGTRISEGDTVNLSEDETLNASWKANTYTVVFNPQGGTVDEESKTVTYQKPYGELPTPIKKGYSFEGWYASTTGTRISEDDTVNLTKDETLNARWVANTYTVMFNPQGGTVAADSKSVTYGELYGELPTPVREGYSFRGWYTESALGSIITADNLVAIEEAQTLYARWAANTYTVYFDAMEGTVAPESKQVAFEGNYGELPIPSREGYSFEGWYTNLGAGIMVLPGDRFTIADNVTLYAKWTANTYTVSFYSNGGSEVREQYVKYNENLKRPADPIRSGYTFVNWYTDNLSFLKLFDFISTPIKENQSLYAMWMANNYSVLFDAQGGNISTESKTVIYDAAYGLLPTPERAGYSFEGWYTAPSAGKLVTSEDKVAITETQTLFARWSAKSYKVSFEAQGGTVGIDSITVTYDSEYGLLPVPEREGYSFAGWYTLPSYGVEITSKSVVKITEAQTLYARWNANSYTVNFDAMGGTVSPNSKTVTYGLAYGELPTPERTGYRFEGWYTNLSAGRLVTFGDKVAITETQVLFAKWTPVSYKVSFDAQGGTVITASITVTYDSEYGLLPVPEREGYSFAGWYTLPDGGLEITSKSIVKITEPQTLYARWNANSYKVTFDALGGTVNPSSKMVTFGLTYGELPTPEKAGYNFEGWYTYATAGVKVQSEDKVSKASDETLFARWSEIMPSDEDAVDEALQKLTVDTGVKFETVSDTWESVTGKFTLINKGVYDTSISWASNKPAVIDVSNMTGSMLGTVTRPQDEEEFVVITATVSKGNAMGKKTFLFIVKPVNLTKQQQNTRVSTDVNATVGGSGSSEESNINIKRTFFDGGNEVIDTLVVTVDAVKNITDRLSSETSEDTKAVTINMTEPTDETIKIKSQSVEIPSAGVKLIAGKDAALILNVGATTITIDAATLKKISETSSDLFFNVKPINDSSKRKQLSDAIDSNEDVVKLKQSLENGEIVLEGTPYAVETNYTGYDTDLMLPFKEMTIPETNRDAFLSSLRVYIEHTDGTKEVVEGSIAYKDGEPVGIRIHLNKFSSFQIISMNTKTVEGETPQSPPQNLPKTGTIIDFVALNVSGALAILMGLALVLKSKRRAEEN